LRHIPLANPAPSSRAHEAFFARRPVLHGPDSRSWTGPSSREAPRHRIRRPTREPHRERRGHFVTAKGPFSVHAPFLASPEGFAQFAAQYLSGSIAGKGLDEVYALWRLVSCDTGTREGDDILRIWAFAGFRYDDGLHRFAPFFVRHANHGYVGNIGMAIDRAFDFRRIDVFRASDDHVFHAVVNVDIAVFIQIARIAGAKPAVLVDGLRRGFRQIPITCHIPRRASCDLAHLSWRQLVSGFVEHRHFHTRQRLTSRTHPWVSVHVVIFRRQSDDCAGGFGHPVHLREATPEHLNRLAQKIERNGRSAIPKVFHTRVIRLPRARIAQHDLNGGRDQKNLADALVGDEIQHLSGIEFARNYTFRAGA